MKKLLFGIKGKLALLLLMLVLALVTVTVIGNTTLYRASSSVEKLYDKVFLSVVELSAIQQSYHEKVAISLYKMKNKQLRGEQASEIVKDGLLKIDSLWGSYFNEDKLYKDKEYLDYAMMEFEQFQAHLQKFLNNPSVLSSPDFLTLFDTHLVRVNSVLEKLIEQELLLAEIKTEKMLQEHEASLWDLNSVMTVTLVLFFIFSIFIYRKILDYIKLLKQKQQELESANKKLQCISYNDPLTSLYNKRYFDVVYEGEIKRAIRANSYVTFILINIDFMKQFNFSYGQIKGDMAVVQVAKVLRIVFKRPGDLLFRFENGDFGVFFSNNNKKDVIVLAKKIKKVLKEAQIRNDYSKISEYLTVSMGLSSCVVNECCEKDYIYATAKAMLKKAKERGGDRYEISTDIYSEPEVQKSA